MALPISDSDARGAAIALLTRGMVVAAGLFAVVVFGVVTGGWLVSFDILVSEWLHAHATPAFTSIILALTNAHSMAVISVYTALLVLVLAWKRDWPWLWAVVFTVSGGLLVNWLLKQVFQRARPTLVDPLLTLETYSFPSAHTAGATLFYGVLAAYLIYRIDNTAAKAGIVVVAVCLVAVVAFTRVYLGVHFVSDVLAAACASVAWLAFCLAGMQEYEYRIRTR